MNDVRFEEFTNKVWMGLHNNYPYIINREMAYDDYCDVREWLNGSKINFISKISDKVYTQNSSILNIKFGFHDERDALLFNLRG